MRGARCFSAICSFVVLVALGSPAKALEFWDGRLAIHGYYGMQVRSIVESFQWQNNDWDLTQWYHVLNLEIEADVAPDGFGPFDLVSIFGRVEVRYDCVWTRGCGIFSSADAYGDRAKKLPQRLHRGRRAGYTMQSFNGDQRRYRQFTSYAQNAYTFRDIPTPSRQPIEWGFAPGVSGLSSSKGPDGELGTADDPWPYYTFDFMNPDKCKFGVQKLWGSSDLTGTRMLPHTPDCDIIPNAPMADKAAPLSSLDFSPLIGGVGSGELPLRPAPKVPAGPKKGRGEVAQGLWFPNYKYAEMLRRDKFGSFDQNFSQDELAWNRGASQQDEKELKELYADIELFDSRLWLRIGKQNIVWGKTELFRTTDQFNPQDLALASLPSLEESRIALWALRAVWSFYNVGPLEDVRLELAVNYDEFEPTDVGRCGEPYAPLPVCDKTYGLMANGFVGVALAGEVRPPNPWNSFSGMEVGGRLEWRYDRFSFAITDFYGYNDGGYTDPIFEYNRNVDVVSGRPRWGMETGPCRTGKEKSCLTEKNALEFHSVNQQRFQFICATSVGFSNLDPTACGQSIFNSQNLAIDDPLSPTIAVALSSGISGQDPDAAFPLPTTGGQLLLNLAAYGPEQQARVRAATAGYNNLPAGARTPLVPLVVDPNDGLAANHPIGIQNLFTQWGLSPALTDEQEALLGCGPFYGTNCDIEGIDLMNIEASSQIQSWPMFEGTFTNGRGLWLTTRQDLAQPGTTGFNGGPVCTRYEGGKTYILPGCRGPGDVGYNINQDGSTFGVNLNGPAGAYQRVHPFTGQPWKSEMAIVSWNVLMVLTALSIPGDPKNPTETEFDASDVFRTDGCSYAAPQLCGNLQAYDSIISARRSSIRAGGNGEFGRRDFDWHGGSNLALRYEKRNVLGASMDFAEDFTKSNWSFEFTWIEGLPYADANSLTSINKADSYNLTVSIDRPTFINFLNQNRTIFFNTQWFFQWINGYERGFYANGPFNMLATFTVSTGYFQDRLLPGFTLVYDFHSVSGAGLANVTYRFTENFSATVGMAGFWGHYQTKTPALAGNSAPGTNRVNRGAYQAFVENGLSPIRERDELYFTLRYTF